MKWFNWYDELVVIEKEANVSFTVVNARQLKLILRNFFSR